MVRLVATLKVFRQLSNVSLNDLDRIMEDPVAGERYSCFVEGFLHDSKVKWGIMGNE